DDFTANLFIATAHQYLLIFTEYGKIYWIKVYTIPETKKATQGKAIQNLINIASGDQVRSIIQVRDLKNDDYVDNNYVIMCTRQGIIKKTPLRAYATPRANGIHAIIIRAGDCLLDVKLTNGDNRIVLALESGRAIQFNEQDVRPMGRVSSGMRGITLAHVTDRVMGMACLPVSDITHKKLDLLVVSEHGYGKRSSLDDYRITKRGGKGVKTIHITEKTGKLVAIHAVKNQDELMIINQSGVIIRIEVGKLPLIGRATQGVRLIRLGQNDKIASVAKIDILEGVGGLMDGTAMVGNLLGQENTMTYEMDKNSQSNAINMMMLDDEYTLDYEEEDEDLLEEEEVVSDEDLEEGFSLFNEDDQEELESEEEEEEEEEEEDSI
ncbi:DNA gyrase C-terminal beta-propeller domain-containing protein, partial [Candidatus Cardinium hertigii]|uniref:DNA gyrase C-terminal beta-propeller domain-containing protein n=1 Tax=Candidatus Cardinium hertigii TaxID=247481 RepID=UPI00294FF111